MTDLSREILEKWQVRKTRKQKAAFIDFLRSRIPELQVEEGGFGKNRNLVIGDISEARVLLTAHYDTCARLPFPNFITPKNILVYIFYSLLITIPFFLVFALVFALLQGTLHVFLLSYWAGLLAMVGAMYYVMMGGKPNEHTANDNTSGVITLCEIYAGLTEAERRQVALVFFDNEENGLLGSAFFKKLHKKENWKEKLLINFDCVSDGDHLLFVLNKPSLQRYGTAFEAAFPATDTKQVYIESSSKAFYPSDQTNFPVNTAVAALKKHKIVGLYMNRIHTKHDTVFDEENIRFLTEGTLRWIRNS